MDNERVSYDNLPERVKTGLINRPDLASGLWEKKTIPLDMLSDVIDVTLDNEIEKQSTLAYKEDYLFKRAVCPLAIEIIGGDLLWPADGRHRLTAYRMAVEDDNTLPKSIECWVRI